MREFWYWFWVRRWNNFKPWAGRHLVPDRLKYWVIVGVAVRTNPDGHPGESTALDMMEFLSTKD